MAIPPLITVPLVVSVYPNRCNLSSIHALWPKSMIQLYGKPYLVWQHPWPRLTGFYEVLSPNGYFSSVFSIGLKNIWRLSGTSASWLGILIILCVEGYDFVSRSIVAMSLQMNFSAVFIIWVFSSPNWRYAWCSSRMLLVLSVKQSKSSLFSCVVKYSVSWVRYSFVKIYKYLDTKK